MSNNENENGPIQPLSNRERLEAVGFVRVAKQGSEKWKCPNTGVELTTEEAISTLESAPLINEIWRLWASVIYYLKAWETLRDLFLEFRRLVGLIPPGTDLNYAAPNELYDFVLVKLREREEFIRTRDSFISGIRQIVGNDVPVDENSLLQALGRLWSFRDETAKILGLQFSAADELIFANLRTKIESTNEGPTERFVRSTLRQFCDLETRIDELGNRLGIVENRVGASERDIDLALSKSRIGPVPFDRLLERIERLESFTGLTDMAVENGGVNIAEPHKRK